MICCIYVWSVFYHSDIYFRKVGAFCKVTAFISQMRKFSEYFRICTYLLIELIPRVIFLPTKIFCCPRISRIYTNFRANERNRACSYCRVQPKIFNLYQWINRRPVRSHESHEFNDFALDELGVMCLEGSPNFEFVKIRATDQVAINIIEHVSCKFLDIFGCTRQFK